MCLLSTLPARPLPQPVSEPLAAAASQAVAVVRQFLWYLRQLRQRCGGFHRRCSGFAVFAAAAAASPAAEVASLAVVAVACRLRNLLCYEFIIPGR